MKIDTKNLTRLISELDKFIRQRNTELSLQTLGLIRAGLGDRIAEDSMAENLRIYEEAQARINDAPPAPLAIGGLEDFQMQEPETLMTTTIDSDKTEASMAIVIDADKPRRGRPRKSGEFE